MNADDERHGTYAGYRAHIRAKNKPCEPCKEAQRVNNERYNAGRPSPAPCQDCGASTRSKSGQCGDCRKPSETDNRTEHGNKLTGGRWVTVHGIQRYLTPEDEIALYARRNPLLQRLLAERYGSTGDWWTKHGDRFHDEPSQVAQRRRELADECDPAGGRVRDYRRAMERVA